MNCSKVQSPLIATTSTNCFFHLSAVVADNQCMQGFVSFPRTRFLVDNFYKPRIDVETRNPLVPYLEQLAVSF